MQLISREICRPRIYGPSPYYYVLFRSATKTHFISSQLFFSQRNCLLRSISCFNVNLALETTTHEERQGRHPMNHIAGILSINVKWCSQQHLLALVFGVEQDECWGPTQLIIIYRFLATQKWHRNWPCHGHPKTTHTLWPTYINYSNTTWMERTYSCHHQKPRKAFSGVKRACPGWEQQSAVSDMYRTREAINEWLNKAIKANHVG